VLEDAVVNIFPGAQFVFAGRDGNPRQPTGAFRRCTIVGDLHLSVQGSGVIFEESIDFRGDMFLSAPGATVIFNGPGVNLEQSTIYTDIGTIEVTAPRAAPFVLGAEASIIGSVKIQPRGGGEHGFVNEGTVHLFGGSVESLAFDNRGHFTVASDYRVDVVGTDSLFINSHTGLVMLHRDAELRLNADGPVRNEGLISVGPSARVLTTQQYVQSPFATAEFFIDSAIGSGIMVLGDSGLIPTLEGTLRLLVDDPDEFGMGDEFQLIACAGHVGTFSHLVLPDLDDGRYFTIEYRTDGVYAVVLPAWCPADFNEDGMVNTLDVLEFLNAWNSGETSGDFNGDGHINTLDVLAFLNAWVSGCP
jgi:hypothetical protein